jgi:opacity protein-like surface antigen
MASHPRVRIAAVVGFCVLALASAAQSQETASGFAKNGVYVGASTVPNFTFDGLTFDGSSYYQQIDGEEIIILPRLGRQSTLRVVAGYRTTRGSFEVGYEQTKHAGTFMDRVGEATFRALNFDERIYALTRGRIQPYGLAGLSLPHLTVKDGSAVDDRIGDGTFHGFGLNTEAGVTVFPHPRLGVSAGYRYRIMWFDTAKGVSGTNYELRPRFRETAGNFSVTASVTF